MNDIKCLAFDVDGTLTNSKKEIDVRTKQSIQKAMEKGIQIVISSGRNKDGCEFIYKPLGLENGNHYLSLINGQQIYSFRTGKLMTGKLLSVEECDKIRKISQKYGCVSRFTYDNEALYFVSFSQVVRTSILYILKRVLKKNHTMRKGAKYKETVKVNGPYTFTKKSNKVVLTHTKQFFDRNLEKIKNELPELEVMVVGDGWVEIMPKGVNKASALEWIAKENQYTLENIMAFGDAQNDISMIKACGIGVAMGNALKEVKDAADIIADTNDNNGIGKVIDLYVLQSGN